LSAKKNYPLIKYTSRDFNTIKEDLVDYAKRYYPNTFQDFSEAGFGSLMLDTVSYVGDILSFYLDYSVNETFIDTAIEYDNVLKLGRQMGFKFKGTPISQGQASFYIVVPANAAGNAPDSSYIPTLKKGSSFSSANGVTFTLNEDITFADPSNEIVVATANTTTGVPTGYAIKASGQVISGELLRETVTVGEYKKFRRIELDGDNVSEIVSITDAEGNDYYEVDYLSQDVIYKSVLNRDTNKNKTTAALRPFIVPRRFTSERIRDRMIVQFGYGSDRTERTDPLVDPSKVVLDVHGKDYFTDVSFDPSNLLETDKFGIVPSNTTLTIIYRSNTTGDVNVAANALINVDAPNIEFEDPTSLNLDSIQDVISSLEVNNEEPIVGDTSLPTVEELKQRIYNVYASQNRAVTALDYKSLCYSMPPRFGSIKRVNVIKDPGSFRRNLNAYVISEDEDGKLIQSNTTIKNNLKQWLNQGRMINDTVDILDAKIINIGIDIEIVTALGSNSYDVLNNVVLEVSAIYSKTFDIGEPLYISDIYSIANKVDGVVDTISVRIYQKDGTGYSSDINFSVDDNLSPDGRYITVPENAILEIKNPDIDIKGSIR
jgi:hypothetical protein